LADMFGRKRIFLTGMLIFLVGSVLSGNAQTMTELIAFRAVQGLGAGCLIPVAQTISADLFTMEQRAKVAALYSAMFAFAAIVGPFLGGFLTDHLSWRWVFYVNLPVGIAAAILVKVFMVEPLEHRHKHKLDWLGDVTLLGWTGTLVFALESAGRDYAWGSLTIVGCFTISAVLLVAFLFVEHRAAEPLLPLDLFKVPALRASAIIVVFLGMAAWTRYISLGSIAAAATFPLAVWLILQASWPVLGASIAAATFIIYRHSSNMQRLRAGTESRFSFGARKQ